MIMREFGHRLKELRQAIGISQEKFALGINMDRTYYASVESGKRNVSLCNIQKIAKGFGISIGELFLSQKERKRQMDKKKLQTFRDGIFALRTRRFGTVAEIMIKKLYGLDESGSLAFDKKDAESDARIEVKFSTVMKENDDKIRDDNVIEQCNKANLANRAMSSSDVSTYKFDCNIQQVKRKEFDLLYYGLFFSDRIEIYKMTSDQILNCQGYSDKQHRGNEGEGQFHINQDNIEYHRSNFMERTLSYKELYLLLNEDK